MTCRHTTTARSARDERVWVCLRCGQHLPSTEQLVLEDVGIMNPLHEWAIPIDLPEPPERDGH